jgi:glycosyltransferase involved in cell wall biosynthesis
MGFIVPSGGHTQPQTIAIDGRMIYQPQCHGIARVIIEQIRHLPPNRDVDVVLILPEGATTKFDIADLEQYVDIRTTTDSISHLYQLRDLWRVLRAVHAGVFYSPYHVLAPLKLPCPSVVGVLDCIFESDRRYSSRAWSLAYRANTMRALHQAVAVVTPSAATRAALPGFYGNVPPTTVCPAGVATRSWQGMTATEVDAVKHKFGLTGRFVLHVGARRPHKNQRVLVEAMGALPSDVQLVLVGQRDHRVHDDIDELVARLQLNDRVIALESVTDNELKALYIGASVFAFPSVAEGFGLPPLEAMAADLPVVASAIPPIAEVCRDGALLISPHRPSDWAAALHTVMSDPSIAASLREKGSRAVDAMTWTAGAETLYDLLVSFVEPDRIETSSIEGHRGARRSWAA